jgi:hypothetical protein
MVNGRENRSGVIAVGLPSRWCKESISGFESHAAGFGLNDVMLHAGARAKGDTEV